MNYSQGQPITVTDYRGRRLKRVVWQDTGDSVLITSPSVLERLKAGDFSLIPIRFPKTSVRPLRA